MTMRSIFMFAFFCVASYSHATTTYTFVIDQEMSTIVRSSFFGASTDETFQISGKFNLVVDTSTDIYFRPTARMFPISVELYPLPDPDFVFPSYFLNRYTEVDSDTATFGGSSDGCLEFFARRDRGGSCFSQGNFSSVFGMLDGTTLRLDGTNPINILTFISDKYEYTIHATLASSVPEPTTLLLLGLGCAATVLSSRRLQKASISYKRYNSLNL